MLNRLSQFFEQDVTRPKAYQDFTRRYHEDAAQLSGAEVAQHYGDLAKYLGDQDMDKAHEQAFGQMSEQDRRELAQQYQYATRDPTRPFQGYPAGTHFNQVTQPRQLGKMTRNAAQHDPDLLAELVGPDSPLNSMGAKLAMAGAAVALARQFLSK